jgi:hypothetical protein
MALIMGPFDRGPDAQLGDESRRAMENGVQRKSSGLLVTLFFRHIPPHREFFAAPPAFQIVEIYTHNLGGSMPPSQCGHVQRDVGSFFGFVWPRRITGLFIFGARAQHHVSLKSMFLMTAFCL